jgi:hypothetical protein
MTPVNVVLLMETGSAAERSAHELLEQMQALHGWRVLDPGTEPSQPDLTLIAADSVATAELCLARTSVASRAILIGVASEGFEPGRLSQPQGSLPDLLERTGVVGAVPAPVLSAWSSKPTGFAGRKDLMEAMNTNCFKAFQSRNYCMWGRVPGNDLPEFLAVLAMVMRSNAAEK